jgi:hypothetical protein
LNLSDVSFESCGTKIRQVIAKLMVGIISCSSFHNLATMIELDDGEATTLFNQDCKAFGWIVGCTEETGITRLTLLEREFFERD